jgi:hypothetical protein
MNDPSGCGLGCGAFLALLALGFVLAYWQVFLAALLLALVICAVAYAGLQQNQLRLTDFTAAADRRVRHDPCRVGERFGEIESIRLAGNLQAPRIDVLCRMIAAADGALHGELQQVSLTPPAAAGSLPDWLRAGGITLLEPLSVEAKATRAAMECLRERQWTEQALDNLDQLRGSVITTLAKAQGNELLEAAIPQLQQALNSFDQERQKLHAAHSSAGEMLRKLHDFLGVPDGIRPILNFDLDQLFDPQRLKDLEQSFSEVVLLNDAFRELADHGPG